MVMRGGSKTDTKTDLVEIKEAIRSAGLRATPARMSILRTLRSSTSPVTHAHLAEALDPLGIDKATVFRGLNDLTNAGLLRRTEVGDHVWRFEALDPTAPHSNDHPHFLCVDCGSVKCLENVKLTQSSQRQSEQFGDVTEILLRGHCNECR
jgi:Fur family ferric uptake transcriptional regulator